MAPKEDFTLELDPDMMAEIRQLAEQENRTVDSLLEEALVKLMVARTGGRTRDEAHTLHDESIDKYGELYRKLAD